MTANVVMIFQKPIIIYMDGLILGVNTLYNVMLFCFCKLFAMVGKEVESKKVLLQMLLSSYVLNISHVSGLLSCIHS